MLLPYCVVENTICFDSKTYKYYEVNKKKDDMNWGKIIMGSISNMWEIQTSQSILKMLSLGLGLYLKLFLPTTLSFLHCLSGRGN